MPRFAEDAIKMLLAILSQSGVRIRQKLLITTVAIQ
jgi:hypothetical protein